MAPVRRRAAAKEPADNKPVVKKLADKKPVVKKLADKKPVVKKPAEKKPRPRNVAKIRIDDTIARCPGGTPAYQHRKEFLLIRPSCTEAEVKMARGADYKPLRTYKNLPAGKKKAVRLTREEYCVIRDWRIQNGVAPFRKPKFDTKWGWNHEDAWDVYYMTHTHEDPSYR
ncbi:uncharacterized protein EAE98_001228 [Botrytis deweyae]|uniref:Vps72/YL1 C-terminal domain-containing protein n=1 Tax=Botrytis deweyae TaxID=2478750 RepID=A0ABQ7J0W4_9HELO|nr:uncharacterized protein EAE98_001228 [Botrytis deweyae]KAF7938891.1 hypothetical protein EAE98_001228 [Botrytis deweyae]